MKLGELLKIAGKKLLLIVIVSIFVTLIGVLIMSNSSVSYASKSIIRVEGRFSNSNNEPFKVKTEYIESKIPTIIFESTTLSFNEEVVDQLVKLDFDRYNGINRNSISSSFVVKAQKDTTHLIIATSHADEQLSLDLCRAVQATILRLNGTDNPDGSAGADAYDDGLIKFSIVDEAYSNGEDSNLSITVILILFVASVIVGMILEFLYSLTLPYVNNRLVVETCVNTNQIAIINKQSWIDDIRELFTKLTKGGKQ